jgi:UrcA family protein
LAFRTLSHCTNSAQRERASVRRHPGDALPHLAVMSALINAHADDQVRSESVKFADLNLGSPADVEALYGRIRAAARRVCDQPAGEQVDIRACMRKAESEAIGR